MEAWIETRMFSAVTARTVGSPPTWRRGLKPPHVLTENVLDGVASHVEAWIETLPNPDAEGYHFVASHVEAWIETLTDRYDMACKSVASHVEAWIETLALMPAFTIHASPPTWRRGLKLRVKQQDYAQRTSPPTWRRGLKHIRSKEEINTCTSPPTWRRGLKQ